MDKNIIKLLFDIEEKLNIEKEWIEIVNILTSEEDYEGFKIGLIINEIERLNVAIFNDYEALIEVLQNSKINL